MRTINKYFMAVMIAVMGLCSPVASHALTLFLNFDDVSHIEDVQQAGRSIKLEKRTQVVNNTNYMQVITIKAAPGFEFITPTLPENLQFKTMTTTNTNLDIKFGGSSNSCPDLSQIDIYTKVIGAPDPEPGDTVPVTPTPGDTIPQQGDFTSWFYLDADLNAIDVQVGGKEFIVNPLTKIVGTHEAVKDNMIVSFRPGYEFDEGTGPMGNKLFALADGTIDVPFGPQMIQNGSTCTIKAKESSSSDVSQFKSWVYIDADNIEHISVKVDNADTQLVPKQGKYVAGSANETAMVTITGASGYNLKSVLDVDGKEMSINDNVVTVPISAATIDKTITVKTKADVTYQIWNVLQVDNMDHITVYQDGQRLEFDDEPYIIGTNKQSSKIELRTAENYYFLEVIDPGTRKAISGSPNSDYYKMFFLTPGYRENGSAFQITTAYEGEKINYTSWIQLKNYKNVIVKVNNEDFEVIDGVVGTNDSQATVTIEPKPGYRLISVSSSLGVEPIVDGKASIKIGYLTGLTPGTEYTIVAEKVSGTSKVTFKLEEGTPDDILNFVSDAAGHTITGSLTDGYEVTNGQTCRISFNANYRIDELLVNGKRPSSLPEQMSQFDGVLDLMIYEPTEIYVAAHTAGALKATLVVDNPNYVDVQRYLNEYGDWYSITQDPSGTTAIEISDDYPTIRLQARSQAQITSVTDQLGNKYEVAEGYYFIPVELKNGMTVTVATAAKGQAHMSIYLKNREKADDGQVVFLNDFVPISLKEGYNDVTFYEPAEEMMLTLSDAARTMNVRLFHNYAEVQPKVAGGIAFYVVPKGGDVLHYFFSDPGQALTMPEEYQVTFTITGKVDVELTRDYTMPVSDPTAGFKAWQGTDFDFSAPNAIVKVNDAQVTPNEKDRYVVTVAGDTKVDVKYDESGIENVMVDGTDTQYYDLQGRRIANPGHGIFIQRVGNKTTKIIKN